MRNVWRLFKGDLKRLFGNVITVIIVLGLVALPSIFTWYNVLACWDVFNNTGNLKVAVANSDAGYKSDLVPVKINIGEQVTSALRANDQLDWVITDEDDAIDGTESGEYYAAVVIPEDFSRDMLSFYTDGSKHGTLVYYSNQKKNAIASKITTQGADAISRQVNTTFTETVSAAVLGTLSSIADYAETPQFSKLVSRISLHVSSTGELMRSSSSTVKSYARLLGSSEDLLKSSTDLLQKAGKATHSTEDGIAEAKEGASSVASSLDTAASALSASLSKSAKGYEGLAEEIGGAFDSAGNLASGGSERLASAAGTVNGQAAQVKELAETIDDIANQLSPGARSQARALSKRLSTVAATMEELGSSLESASKGIDSEVKESKARRAEAVKLAKKAKKGLDGSKKYFEKNVEPKLSELEGTVSDASSLLSGLTSTLDEVNAEVGTGADSLYARLGEAQKKLKAAARELDATGKDLIALHKEVNAALESGDSGQVMQILEGDTDARASAIAAPVGVDRVALYPTENFGSAMAPLYTSLAIWIGALLIMVALKPQPSEAIRSTLDDPKSWQMFIGRFGVVALLSLMQTTALGLGNLLFLHVQAGHPLLYLLVLWTSGLVFAFTIYTLVVSFANLGKALAIVLLIVQVAGGGASFPLPLLPQFFQDLSPYLPITHAADAMRAAMFGIYNGDIWTELGVLLLFAVPMLVLGLVLRPPLEPLVGKFVEKVEESKLM